MKRGATRRTAPEVAPLGWRSGASMANTSSSMAGAAAGSPQASGTGFTAAAVAGSIRTTATSRSVSVATTTPVTLSDGENCTSTVVARPMASWLVATSPAASTTNPDACAVGVHTATTLSCHRTESDVPSSSSGDVALVVVGADYGVGVLSGQGEDGVAASDDVDGLRP